MTPTKLTHEELCELWAELCVNTGCYAMWFNGSIVTWAYSPNFDEINAWIEEMEDRYGKDED